MDFDPFFNFVKYNFNILHNLISQHQHENTSIWWIFLLLFVSALLTALYKYSFKSPYTIISERIEPGFEDAVSPYKSNTFKRDLINELMRARKNGKLPPPFPKGWIPICESDSLKKSKVLEVNAFGCNLVAWRGTSGQSYVSDGYCPHLGAHLGVGSSVSGECIKCPFHGWCYDGSQNGKLVHIPYAEDVPSNVSTKMWKSQEKYGLIFVWYPQNEEPSWNLEEIPEIDRDNWSFRGRIVFDTLCHIQDIPENLADVPHLNEVHTDLSTISGDVRKSWIQRSHIRHIHTGEWSPSKKCDENHKAFMTMQHKIEIFQRFHCGYATMKAVHIGPALMLLYMSTPTGKFVIIQGLVPSRELRTRSILRIYAEPRMLQCFVKQLMDGIHNNALRDRVIMNRKSFTDKPFLVKEDKYIKMFRRWYAQFYGETTSNDNE